MRSSRRSGIEQLHLVNEKYRFLKEKPCFNIFKNKIAYNKLNGCRESYDSSLTQQISTQLSMSDLMHIKGDYNSDMLQSKLYGQDIEVNNEPTSEIDCFANEIISKIAKREQNKEYIREIVVKHLKQKRMKTKNKLTGDIYSDIQYMKLKNNQERDQQLMFKAHQQFFMNQNEVDQFKLNRGSVLQIQDTKKFRESSVPLPTIFSKQISSKKAINHENYPPIERNIYDLNVQDTNYPKIKSIYGTQEQNMNETLVSSIIKQVNSTQFTTATYASNLVTMANKILNKSTDMENEKSKLLQPIYRTNNYMKQKTTRY